MTRGRGRARGRHRQKTKSNECRPLNELEYNQLRPKISNTQERLVFIYLCLDRRLKYTLNPDLLRVITMFATGNPSFRSGRWYPPRTYEEEKEITEYMRKGYASLERAGSSAEVNAEVAVAVADVVTGQIPITVHSAEQTWTLWCQENQPLSALFDPLERSVGKRCLLSYINSTGVHMLDRRQTPSFYGMIYDDNVSLAGTVQVCDDLES